MIMMKSLENWFIFKIQNVWFGCSGCWWQFLFGEFVGKETREAWRDRRVWGAGGLRRHPHPPEWHFFTCPQPLLLCAVTCWIIEVSSCSVFGTTDSGRKVGSLTWVSQYESKRLPRGMKGQVLTLKCVIDHHIRTISDVRVCKSWWVERWAD